MTLIRYDTRTGTETYDCREEAQQRADEIGRAVWYDNGDGTYTVSSRVDECTVT